MLMIKGKTLKHGISKNKGRRRQSRALMAFLAVFALLVCSDMAWATEKQTAHKGLAAAAAAAMPNGDIRLFWIAPPLQWPSGGWRISDNATGQVIEPQALPQRQEGGGPDTSKFSELFMDRTDPKRRDVTYLLFRARAISDWRFAEAAGMARVVKGLQPGKRSFRIEGLDSEGKTTGLILVSNAVDPSVPSPPPAPPSGLRAEPQEKGVALFWRQLKDSRMLRPSAYEVERLVSSGSPEIITKAPVFIPGGYDGKKPLFTDLSAPAEMELTYAVFGLDLFGRRSEPVRVRITVPDLSALTPPLMKVKGTAGTVELSWEAEPNTHRSGFVLERSLLAGGPYEALTEGPLKPDAAAYTDRKVRGGSAYFYRIRSVSSRGILGEPSRIVTATPVNAEPPPAPEGLRADPGATRVRLSWRSVPFPVAGYVVERKAKGAEDFSLLNVKPKPEPLFDDFFPATATGSFTYRVSAVGFDQQRSEPGREVTVELPDRFPPNAPSITAIEGQNGRVRLRFRPAPPEEDIFQFLVVRGVSEDDPGLVIGDPLPAAAQDFEDSFVTIGQRYWYRIAAVDRKGNRSDLSSPRYITVMNPALPFPRKPQGRLVREPVEHVVISFESPPEQHGVLIQRKAEGEERWTTIIGPVLNATQAADIRIPAKGSLSYRIIFQAPNGVTGKPSEAVTIPR